MNNTRRAERRNQPLKMHGNTSTSVAKYCTLLALVLLRTSVKEAKTKQNCNLA